MIKNPFQLRNARNRIAILREKLPVLMEAKYPQEEEFIKTNNLQALTMEIDELEKEIDEFMRLDGGDTAGLAPLTTIREAGDTLTKWRIAKAMPMNMLAARMKMNPVELEKHEMADWETAPLGLLIHIAMVIEEYQPADS